MAKGDSGMRKRTLVRAGVAAVTIAAVVILASPNGAFGQSSSTPSTSPAQKVDFVEGTTADIKYTNPFTAISSSEYEILELNYDLLLQFGQKDLSASPGLAEMPTQSADGLTWTFKMRPGATWQDGQPVTSRDVLWTYRFVLQNDIGTLTSYFPFTTPDSFSAPDDQTFVWKTSKPTSAPLYPAWVYILPEHIWSKLSVKKASTDNSPVFPLVGSGAFQMDQWNKTAHTWSLSANKNYWGGAPQIDNYVIKKYDNVEAMVNALKTGDIDYASGISPDLFNSLKGIDGVTTNAGVPSGFANLIFNTRGDYPAPDSSSNPIGTGHPALLDPRVRTAIAMAIDKQDLVDRVLRGFGQPGTSIVPPRSAFWHWQPTPDETIPFDIAGANKILDDAGYVDTNGDGVREMPGGGKPLDFRLDIESEDSSRVRAARYIAGYLKQIGIQVTTQADSYQKTLAFWTANDFDMYMWGWGPDPDPSFILSVFTTDQCEIWSDACWSNKKYDQLYEEQKSATDLDARQKIVFQMQQLLYKENPEIVTYYDDTLEAYRSDRWTGFRLSPDPNGYLLNQYTTYSAITMHPLSAGQANAGSGGISTGVWGALLLGIAAIILIVVLVRRRKPDEERA